MKYIKLMQNYTQLKCKCITLCLLLSEIITEAMECRVILIFVALTIFINHVYSVFCGRF